MVVRISPGLLAVFLATISTIHSIVREAGAATYFSSGYQCSWWNNCSNPANCYAWNTSTETQSGTLLALGLGSTWGSTIASQDASGHTLAAQLSAPLSSAMQSNVVPTSCADIGPDANGYTYHYCSSANYQTTVTMGITAY